MQGSGVKLEVSQTRQIQAHKSYKTDRDRDLTGIKRGIIFPVGGGRIIVSVQILYIGMQLYFG